MFPTSFQFSLSSFSILLLDNTSKNLSEDLSKDIWPRNMLLSFSSKEKYTDVLSRLSFFVFPINWHIAKRVAFIFSDEAIEELVLVWRCKTLYLSRHLYLCGNDFFGSKSLRDCWNKRQNTGREEGNYTKVLNNDGNENNVVFNGGSFGVYKHSETVIILCLLDVQNLILVY